jgi:hypothetical protein
MRFAEGVFGSKILFAKRFGVAELGLLGQLCRCYVEYGIPCAALGDNFLSKECSAKPVQILWHPSSHLQSVPKRNDRGLYRFQARNEDKPFPFHPT